MWIEANIAFKFLRQGRIQTALILVGVAVGVAVIVFVVALINGLQGNIIERTLGTQSHIRVQPPEEVNLRPPAPTGTIELLNEDQRPQRLRSINNWLEVQAALDQMPGLKAVSPMTSGPGFARRGEVLRSVSLMGIDPARYERIIPIRDDIIEGEFRVGAGDAVIGKQLASELGLKAGNKLRLEAGLGRDAIVNVAGIFELGVRELDARFVYLDLTQAQALLALPGGVTQIDVTVNDIFAADASSGRIARLTGLKSESWMETNAQLMNALTSQSISTNIISLMVALSVAFGIASVLAVSVTQRTREIGILRAIGTTRRQMLGVFLLQGGLVGLVGSSLGGFAAYGLVWLFNTVGPGLFYIPIDPSLIPASMALATVTGVLSAMTPAWRASRLDPVVAIRYV
jgi:lipoprotein-releasing system permease protein